ncbi:MAG: DNA methyltransferase [bacterium]
MEDINYALVEECRPPIYTAMKYWGKKPHNIWREYIKNYTPENGIYLDPFAGSAVSAFEAVKAGRKAIAFDLNPITVFTIEVLASDFSIDKFKSNVRNIISTLESDIIYQQYFFTTCRYCDNKNAVVQNYKWNKDELYEVGVICNCDAGRYIAIPNQTEQNIANSLDNIKIDTWCPNKQFRKSESFNANFKRCICGNNFANLWTKRNLYVLSKIYDLILKEQDDTIKKQLIFGFIQSVHLCTKMSVPRAERGNRPFSTSWGRSAYLCSARKMEMNPLLVFEGNCIGKQSVESALKDAQTYIGRKKPKLLYIDERNKKNRSKNFDIKYGIVDVNTLTDYIDEKSIDFIMTDPPYGGLVQYLDLSSIWLVWLEKYDIKYKPNFSTEITYNKKTHNTFEAYKIRFQNAIKNLYKVLNDDGKIVFTFHNKKIKIWNTFLNAISMAGFKIEKVIHQQNRRTGESNVANPYGTSASDFYIRCIKQPITKNIIKTDNEEFEEFVVKKTIQLIAERNEPTPFQILFNGLLVEISQAGFNLEDFDKNVESVLSKYIDNIFIITKNETTKSGNFWWFKNPNEHIKYPNIKLSERVEETIIAFLRRKVSVSLDGVLAEIFIKYPNGLTPDIKTIDSILGKYANKSGGKWIYKGNEIEREFTKHTEMLYYLANIGKKLGFNIFIGLREQPDKFNNIELRNSMDIEFLEIISGFNDAQLSRIKWIDMLWLDQNNNIKYALEVENSTNFTSGIQRASNLDNNIPKIMVIPDERIDEFKKIKDPLFIDSFKNQKWKYLVFSMVENLKSSKKLSETDLYKFLV